jgi:hypothetical protein
LLFYAFIFCNLVNAQENATSKIPSKHSLYIDLLGKTLTYEYELHRYKNSTLSQSAGFYSQGFHKKDSFYFFNNIFKESRRLKFTFLTYSINWISHSKKEDHFELGLGLTYVTNGNYFLNSISGPVFNMKIPFPRGIYFSPNIGYRYTGKKGFLFRAYYCPAISNLFYPHYQHLAGISLGYNFRKKEK